jgi:hypothetical protein
MVDALYCSGISVPPYKTVRCQRIRHAGNEQYQQFYYVLVFVKLEKTLANNFEMCELAW